MKKLTVFLVSLLLSVSAMATDVKTLTQKAQAGDTKAQMELADYYQDKQDYANAFYWVKKLAEKDYPVSQYNLGVMYSKGRGVRQDYAQAKFWYEKSAKQGLASAQTSLGTMYANGLGVRQDFAKAKDWFLKAANQNEALAQGKLGAMYDDGEGVRQNKQQAKEWFGKACDNGNQDGCDLYRILNEQGH